VLVILSNRYIVCFYHFLYKQICPNLQYTLNQLLPFKSDSELGNLNKATLTLVEWCIFGDNTYNHSLKPIEN
jgi:hypothetical protein